MPNMPAPMAFCEKGCVRNIGQAWGPFRGGGAARVSALLGCLTVAAPFVGCEKPTAENIQVWKTTEKGPGKLGEALRDRKVDAKLRAQAAMALVDIGKGDEVEAALAAMPPSERFDVVRALVPLYVSAMGPGGGATPEKTLAARDALFSLRALASPEDQVQIDAALMPTIEADLRAGRVRNGRQSVEKILQTIGAPAGTMLAKLLGEPIPGYGAVADLLARVGDENARQMGASALVARASREKSIPDPMWKAIGVLGGPAALKFLEDKIQHGNHDETVAAVRALQQRREPQALPFALRVAGDPKADRAVRDEMFGVVETIGGPAAKDGLIKIIQSDHDELVRYRAFESLLAVSKQDGIVAGLEAFPASATYKQVDVDDLLVKLIEKLGPAARPALLQALDSKFPLARMTAVMSLERLGQAGDAAPLGKLGKDTTMIKGFPTGDTIGKEATRVAGVLRSKG
jgi:hypothetical protein